MEPSAGHSVCVSAPVRVHRRCAALRSVLSSSHARRNAAEKRRPPPASAPRTESSPRTLDDDIPATSDQSRLVEEMELVCPLSVTLMLE
ncbi:Hypothetical protein SMAX5B_019339 [Scophthalmus maximus]|uniref:Uncharacterized protein n=1 Tax=Scophthalmus maximus TaxID=52904 RepID=A0A2U9BUE7_SCOMX|nr:Hypothetical protein SMAX5B_019339 [Scophthalmus maximus]